MSKVGGSGDGKSTLYCSFCGKSQHEVRKLIAGPTVFICDECVELCMDIIREESKASLVKTQDGVPTPTEILDMRARLNKIYVAHTGQSLRKIEDALERDTFMTAEQAKDFGLVDEVTERRVEESAKSE